MDAQTDTHDIDRIAHDVINTVAAISGRAQLTRRRIEKLDILSRDHIAADLRLIEEQAARAGALVEACRAAAGKQAPGADSPGLRRPPTMSGDGRSG